MNSLENNRAVTLALLALLNKLRGQIHIRSDSPSMSLLFGNASAHDA